MLVVTGRVRRLLSVWAILVLTVAMVIVAPPAARAQDPQQPPAMEVSVTSVSPAVLDVNNPDQEVVISGTITNASQEALRFVVVHFWAGPGQPITDLEQLEAAVAQPPGIDEGTRLQDEPQRQLQVITRDDSFLPSQSAPFEVRATLKELGITTDNAVYQLGVHVRAVVDGVGKQTVGTSRVLSVATSHKLRRGGVVAITAPPSKLPSGEFVDDSLTQAIRGHLLELAQGANTRDLTVAVDPAVIVGAQKLTEAHTVRGRPLAAIPEAKELLGELDKAKTRGKLVRLPYGNLDVEQMAALGETDTLLGWNQALAQAGMSDLPLWFYTEGNKELVDTLLAEEPGGIFSTALSSGQVSDIPVLQVRPVESEGLDGQNGPPHALGLRLARQLLAPVTPVYWIQSRADLDAMKLAADAQQDAAISFGELAPTQVGEGRTPEPWEALIPSVEAGKVRLDLAQSAPDGPEVAGLMQGFSRNWQDPSQAQAWFRALDLGKPAGDQLSIRAVSQVVMNSGGSQIPITVTNHMPTSVTVRLGFASSMPQRIFVPSTELVTIGPGESQTLTVHPEALSNGVVTVTAVMETANGYKVGAPFTFRITANDLGRWSWLIIIISGAVVLGGTFYRIHSVNREKAKET